jgi:hypothetical protein
VTNEAVDRLFQRLAKLRHGALSSRSAPPTTTSPRPVPSACRRLPVPASPSDLTRLQAAPGRSPGLPDPGRQ